VNQYNLNDRGGSVAQAYTRQLVDAQGRRLESYLYNTQSGGAYLPIADADAANLTAKVRL
jgi:hypothetical protein